MMEIARASLLCIDGRLTPEFEGDYGSEDDDALASSQVKVCLSASFSQQCSIAAKAFRDDDKPKVLAPAIVGHS